MTLNQTINRIKTIALAHKQVRTFYKGITQDFLTDKTTKYAGVFLQDNGGKISLTGHATTLNFKMFFLDLVHVSEDSKQNEQDVQSDMVSVAMDVLSQMNNGNYNDWVISADNTIQTLLQEYDNDMLAGCVIDISIRIKFDQNICAVPTELTDYVPTDNDMKLVYDETYIATGNEGSSLAIPAIVGKKLLFATREYAPIYKVSNNPNSSEYTWNDVTVVTGAVTFPGERFLFLWRNY